MVLAVNSAFRKLKTISTLGSCRFPKTSDSRRHQRAHRARPVSERWSSREASAARLLGSTRPTAKNRENLTEGRVVSAARCRPYAIFLRFSTTHSNPDPPAATTDCQPIVSRLVGTLTIGNIRTVLRLA